MSVYFVTGTVSSFRRLGPVAATSPKATGPLHRRGLASSRNILATLNVQLLWTAETY